MNDVNTEVFVKAWENYHRTINKQDENCWFIRVIGFGFWSVSLGFSYQCREIDLLYFSILIIICLFFIELGIRQVQEEYIKKCLEIETIINETLLGHEVTQPIEGVFVNYTIPTVCNFYRLFELKQWGIMFPYLVVLLINLLCFICR